MKLAFEPNDNSQWWVDSSYAVHPDMKSNTGNYMTILKGPSYTSSCKQKSKINNASKSD